MLHLLERMESHMSASESHGNENHEGHLQKVHMFQRYEIFVEADSDDSARVQTLQIISPISPGDCLRTALGAAAHTNHRHFAGGYSQFVSGPQVSACNPSWREKPPANRSVTVATVPKKKKFFDAR